MRIDCGVSGVRGMAKGNVDGNAVPDEEEYKIISVELSSISR